MSDSELVSASFDGSKRYGWVRPMKLPARASIAAAGYVLVLYAEGAPFPHGGVVPAPLTGTAAFHSREKSSFSLSSRPHFI